MHFREHLTQVINQLAPEYRVVVADSLRLSGGSPEIFEQELQAAVWDHPELPVQDIMHLITVDR